MWVTQTYLSTPEPNAGLHLYYLFENYKTNHVEVTKELQIELERISCTYPDVCILIPSSRSTDRIEGELRKNQRLWQRFAGDLPGIVVSRRPIEKIEHDTDEIFFIPLNYHRYSENTHLDRKQDLCDIMQRLRTMIADEMSWKYSQNESYKSKSDGFLRGIFEAVELKPGIGGFRVDLKKLSALRRKI